MHTHTHTHKGKPEISESPPTKKNPHRESVGNSCHLAHAPDARNPRSAEQRSDVRTPLPRIPQAAVLKASSLNSRAHSALPRAASPHFRAPQRKASFPEYLALYTDFRLLLFSTQSSAVRGAAASIAFSGLPVSADRGLSNLSHPPRDIREDDRQRRTRLCDISVEQGEECLTAQAATLHISNTSRAARSRAGPCLITLSPHDFSSRANLRPIRNAREAYYARKYTLHH